jgi:hypothetical protein
MHPKQTQFLQRVLFIFLGIIFASGPLVAQKELLLPKSQKQLVLSNEVLSCYSPEANSYYVFDDSTHYWQYQIKRGVWEAKPLQIKLELPWAQFKKEFLVQAVGNNKIYFIAKGCGIVYELKNQVLERIDVSFDHKNQFGASVFTYKNKVHFFGGYGFFKTKNLITYFEPSALEWFEVVNRNYDLRPPTRQNAQNTIIGSKLFVWGGIGRRGFDDKPLLDMWCFDFKTQLWSFYAELNQNYAKFAEHIHPVGNVPQEWFVSLEEIVHTDQYNNRIYTYHHPRFLTYQNLIPNKDEQFFMVLRRNTNAPNSTAQVLSKKALLAGTTGQEQFFYKKLSIFKKIPLDSYLWFSLLLNLVLFLLLFYIRRVHKTDWYKRRNAILKSSDFSDLEWRCITLIHQHGSIELSALNDLFDEEQLSFETLKKRRESFIKALRTKIALLTALDVDDILFETKHPVDKRMKVINWSDQLEINPKD